jgi:hypothetical protein
LNHFAVSSNLPFFLGLLRFRCIFRRSLFFFHKSKQMVGLHPIVILSFLIISISLVFWILILIIVFFFIVAVILIIIFVIKFASFWGLVCILFQFITSFVFLTLGFF